MFKSVARKNQYGYQVKWLDKLIKIYLYSYVTHLNYNTFENLYPHTSSIFHILDIYHVKIWIAFFFFYLYVHLVWTFIIFYLFSDVHPIVSNRTFLKYSLFKVCNDD